MVKKLFARLIWIPLGLGAIVFLVANRQPVAVSLDPFSTDAPVVASPALPLWVWLMMMLLVGFFLGAATMWTSARGQRRKARADRKELNKLKRDGSQPAPSPANGDNLPVLKAS